MGMGMGMGRTPCARLRLKQPRLHLGLDLRTRALAATGDGGVAAAVPLGSAQPCEAARRDGGVAGGALTSGLEGGGSSGLERRGVQLRS